MQGNQPPAACQVSKQHCNLVLAHVLIQHAMRKQIVSTERPSSLMLEVQAICCSAGSPLSLKVHLTTCVARYRESEADMSLHQLLWRCDMSSRGGATRRTGPYQMFCRVCCSKRYNCPCALAAEHHPVTTMRSLFALPMLLRRTTLMI